MFLIGLSQIIVFVNGVTLLNDNMDLVYVDIIKVSLDDDNFDDDDPENIIHVALMACFNR